MFYPETPEMSFFCSSSSSGVSLENVLQKRPQRSAVIIYETQEIRSPGFGFRDRCCRSRFPGVSSELLLFCSSCCRTPHLRAWMVAARVGVSAGPPRFLRDAPLDLRGNFMAQRGNKASLMLFQKLQTFPAAHKDAVLLQPAELYQQMSTQRCLRPFQRRSRWSFWVLLS